MVIVSRAEKSSQRWRVLARRRKGADDRRRGRWAWWVIELTAERGVVGEPDDENADMDERPETDESE